MMQLKNDQPLYSLTVGEYIELHQSLVNVIPSANSVAEKEKDLLTISEAADYLDLAVSTLYAMNSRRQIPFSKVLGKVYYRRSVLDEWLASGERKTTAQLSAETRKEGER
ncbi:helix-turn-helix domain-containing protein [Breznakibacter xylanolyticus]|nr:helix-turn-helix domain-containing protein [Breznakibacter xylanolyticus]